MSITKNPSDWEGELGEEEETTIREDTTTVDRHVILVFSLSVRATNAAKIAATQLISCFFQAKFQDFDEISHHYKYQRVGTRPGSRCDMRFFRKITDYSLSQNEAFPLMKCIRQYV